MVSLSVILVSSWCIRDIALAIYRTIYCVESDFSCQAISHNVRLNWPDMSDHPPQDEWIRMTCRLPPKMHAELKAVADRTGSSINAEMVRRIELTLPGDGNPLDTLRMIVHQLEGRSLMP